MNRSITVISKKRRGPKPTGQGKPVMVRFHDPLLTAIDDFIDAQPLSPKPTRPSAVRMLVEDALKRAGFLKR
jgi:hypothetical protein